MPLPVKMFTVAALTAAIGLSGCSKAQPKDSTASTGSSSAASSASSSAQAPSSSVAPPSPTATVPASFNGRCEDLLPLSVVTDALQRPVIGRTASVVGIAEPNIGRLAYLNCRYGIATAVVAKKQVTQTNVEIGVSLYTTAQQADKRVQATVDDYLSQGATRHPVVVGQFSGQILLGSGSPTIVVAAGPRTTAITVSQKVLGASVGKPLASLAAAVLNATAAFNQGGPATPGSSGSAVPSSSSS